MTCYHPQRAFQYFNKGEKVVTFSYREARQHAYVELQLPCKKCTGCMLDRSAAIAVRSVHEALCHDHNSFITLTVDDAHMEEVFPNCSLRKRPMQLFNKRLRRHFEPDQIRILYCGEYGEDHYRPHYHALLFGCDFKDKYFWKCERGVVCYRSPTLEELWPYGFSTIGDVTFNSAAYVGRYCAKKLFVNDFTPQDIRDKYFKKYVYIDSDTGEIKERQKEFIVFPNKPGLGREWFEKHELDIYDKFRLESMCRVKNYKGEIKFFKTPEYYDKLELDRDFDFMHDLKSHRQSVAKERKLTWQDLEAEEYYASVKLKLLKGNL